jgi:hypothetical protein
MLYAAQNTFEILIGYMLKKNILTLTHWINPGQPLLTSETHDMKYEIMIKL